MGTLHCGGVGGVPAKPGSYIYIYTVFVYFSSGSQTKASFANVIGRSGSSKAC